MAIVTITLDGLAGTINADAETIRQFLRGPAANATRKKISIVAVAGVKDHFARSTSPDGIPWAPLLMRAGKPLLDTGRMRDSTVATVTDDGVVLSNNNIQSSVHQFGATITPKRGKYLAIPLTPTARRAGSPRNVDGLHFQSRKGGKGGVLADDKGQAVFALVPSVTIKARPFLGFSETTLAKTERIIVDDLRKVLESGNGG